MPDRYTPADRERAEVARLESEQRYVYFVRRVVHWEAAWGLVDDTGWALVGDDGGGEALALWPALGYAQDAAIDRWADLSPRPITLDDLLATFLPNVREGGLRFGVFPAPPRRGSITSADALEESLREEIERLY
jgi:hypothetical protein